MNDRATRLLVQGVSRSFGATKALEAVDLRAHAGEVHAVLGENGAGKSTLMNILGGNLDADAGQCLLDGAAYRPASPADARRHGVSMVSQELAVCPHLSVMDNVMLGQELTRRAVLDRAAMRRLVVETLRPLAGDDASHIDPEMLVRDLPMAAKQLVEIARALVSTSGCKLLILDEPTSSLGQDDAHRLFDVIRRLRDNGLTILYVSHFLEEVMTIADRFTVLRDGATVGEGSIAQATISGLVAMMAGRQIETLFVRSPRSAGEVVLELNELRGSPKPLRASLTLHRGEVLGVAGLVGAGRTELLRTIFGLAPVRSGSIRVKTWLGPASPSRRLQQGMGFLSEDRQGEGLAMAMSIVDNMTLSKLPTRGPILSLRGQRAIAQAWIKRLAIRAHSAEQPVSALSGGNQQKVALARLLHHDADVLLLDEPTRGIDVGSKAQLYELIDQLAKEGKAILMVSSYLPELLGVCDRICVMRRGELGPAHPVEEWTQHTLLEEATVAAAV